jgi:hypothetical protein
MASTWPDDLKEPTPRTGPTYKLAPRPLEVSVVEELVQAYRDGVGVGQLSERFGVHRQTAAKHLLAHGIDTRKPRLTFDDVYEAAQLYRVGWSLGQLGTKYGVAGNVIRRRLLKVGVVMRKPGGSRPHAERD